MPEASEAPVHAVMWVLVNVPDNIELAELLVTSSYVLLVVRPGAPSSVLAPSSDALCS